MRFEVKALLKIRGINKLILLLIDRNVIKVMFGVTE